MKNKHAGVEKRQVARYLKSVALKAIPEESSDYALTVYDKAMSTGGSGPDALEFTKFAFPWTLSKASLRGFKRSKFYKPRKHVKKESENNLFLRFVKSHDPCDDGYMAIEKAIAGPGNDWERIVRLWVSESYTAKERYVRWLFNKVNNKTTIIKVLSREFDKFKKENR